MNPSINGSSWASFITSFDYVLLPFYLGLVYFVAFRICNKKYPAGTRKTHPWRKYFLAGFSLKIAGAIFIGLAYEYYYHGGDTSAFMYHAKVINQSFGDSVFKWLNLIFHTASPYDPSYYKYINQMMWYGDKSAYMTCSITAFISLFTFNTYLPTSIIFAALSFTGTWAVFRLFAELYPKLTKQLAVCILFLPSAIVWGSGIFKDTICMAALSWMTFVVFRMLVHRKVTLRYLGICAFCFYILTVIKIYIVLVFVPALLLWILNTYSHRIRNKALRSLLIFFVYGMIGAGFIAVTTVFAGQLGQYSLDRLANTSNTTRTYIYYVSTTTTGDEGSAYDLGAFEPTIGGMLTKFPLAVNVTLFRPYIWEARKAIVLLNSVEAMLFLFFTLKVLFSVGLKNTWRAIARNPTIQFFLVFTLIFAFSVGISSYNFGALSRYRIPCLPFYAMALVLIYYNGRSPDRRFFSFSFK